MIEVEYDNASPKYKFEENSTTARLESPEKFFTYCQFKTQNWNNQVFRVMIYARNLKQEKYAINIDVLQEVFKAEWYPGQYHKMSLYASFLIYIPKNKGDWLSPISKASIRSIFLPALH